eukprot:2146677-Rhodomonas_salina.2
MGQQPIDLDSVVLNFSWVEVQNPAKVPDDSQFPSPTVTESQPEAGTSSCASVSCRSAHLIHVCTVARILGRHCQPECTDSVRLPGWQPAAVPVTVVTQT